MKRSVTALGLMMLSATLATAHAGPYAALAAKVKASGGILRIVAMGGLETQAAATLDATAIGACHTMATEGVSVTAVQIVTEAGQTIRVVSGETLNGC